MNKVYRVIWSRTKNCYVIVSDDIATTGASLEEAARLLKEGGAEKVVGLVLASNAPMASVSNLD